MQLSSSRLKFLARNQLKKNLMLPVSVTSMYIFIYALFSLYYTYVTSHSVSIVSTLIPVGIACLFSLFFSVFSVGISRIYLQLAEHHESLIGEFLYGIRHMPDRIIGIAFVQMLLTRLPLLPGIIILISYYMNGCHQELLVALGMLLLLIGAAICYVLSLSLSQCYFIFAENSELSVMEVLHTSRLLMKGQKSRLFFLQLSFIPAFLFSMLTMYLGFFLTVPYYFASITYFHLELTNRIRREMFFTEER